MKPKVMVRLSKRFLVVAALIILIIGSSVATIPVRAPSGSKIVYVAICFDSENSGFGGIGSTNPHPTLNVSTYSRTSPSTVAAVFDSGFRNSHQDSFGNIFKLSWFPQMDYLMAQSNFVWADGSPAGVSGYTAIRDLLVNTWGTEIQTYGDSIEYHHHFMIYDGTWQRYNSGPDAGYPGYQMYALDHMIIDRNFYPSTWRSGDWIMPPALSSWLEQWMPFDYTPTTGIWYPVHPSGMDRWQTKCPYGEVSTDINSAFAYASEHGSAVYSFCAHDYEDMKAHVVWLQTCLNTADANEAAYPNVSFKYVSAREAMQLALGVTDFSPPTFTVTKSDNTYTIVSSEPLWKNHPYVALKYTDGTYGHMSATPTGINTWTVTPPTGANAIGVAGSDLYGNPGTAAFIQGQYALTVGTVGYGSVTKNPDQASYAPGTVVSLTAVPLAGWSFSAWSGDVVSSSNPVQVTMDSAKSVTATFTQNAYTLTVSTVGSGSVVKVPDQASYHLGDSVQLTATPVAGWTFSGWSGDLAGSANPATLVIDANPTVTATFTRYAYTLTVSTVGSGSVVKVPDQVSTFGYATQATYGLEPLGNLIAGYQAAPATSGTLTKITARLSGTWVTGSTMKAKCALYYGSDKTLVPNSETNEIAWTNAVSAAWYDFGYTGRTPPSVAAGVTYIIVVWASASAGGNIYMAYDRKISDPAFYGITQSLSYASAFPGSLLSPVNTPRKYSIYATYVPDQASYQFGDVVQLTVVPSAGWSFDGWSGDLSGSANPVTITMNGDKSVTATFFKNECNLTINVVGQGSVSKQPDQAVYIHGTTVQLTAAPQVGWSFSYWGGGLSGSNNPATITMTGDKSVTATFTQDQYTLTVNVVGGGSVTKVPDQATYHYGDVVQLTALPAAGWSFSAWSGDASGSVNPVSVTIDGNMSVTATFTQDQYTLTVNVAGAGCSVTKSPDQATYTYGTSVQLTPVAASGWTFSGWSGDLTGTAVPGTVSMTGSKTVTATFTQNTYTLTVTILGSGSVDLNDSGPYHYGDIVGLTANPAAGWSFNHWNGDLIGSVNPTTILIDSNKAVTATFTQDTYTLTISTVGSGVVNLNNSGPYYYGDVVELTAVPATGWSFSGWSGDLSGSNNAASITMTGDRSVTATFTQDHYTLTVNVVGGGSVTKDPDQATYAYGDSVRLTAIPALGWSFASWSGDLSGSTNPETIIITNSVSITAHFSQNQYTLTVNIEGSGSVDKVPDQATYDYGTLVTLTAVANAGWSFGGWNGDATGSLNPVSVIINGTTSVTATFTQNTYRITVTQDANGVISPETIDVEYGSDKAFTITPDNGYHIFDVVVDDIPQGAVSSYLFSNVVANHTISASFAIDVYKPFSVVSNSTISELAFNSTSQVLSFTAGGPSGTTGFSNVTISKTLIADVSGLEVYLDGTKTGYVVSDLTTSWLIYITYQHSTHKIVVNFALPPGARADYVSHIALVAILGLIVALVLTVFAKRRGKSSQSEARARS